MYDVCHAQRTFGRSFTLNVADLHIAVGETVCLLGPTGAGKSTLLNLMAGLDTPTSGEVRFADSPLVAASLPVAVRRRIAVIHQRPLLLSGTVRSNVEFGLRIRGTKKRSTRVDAVLERLGLQKLAAQSAHTLSGGQIHLVALARALVLETDVLLLDEPTANLDPARVALVEEVVGEMQQKRGTTVVWATHNLFQARRVAQRVALLWDGELVEVAETEQFFENPSHPRTVDFVRGRLVY